MKKALLGLTCLFMSFISLAGQNKLHIMSAWAPATFKLAVTGAAYVSAHNMSGNPVEIVKLSVDSNIASRVELHETIIDNEMASMRQIELPLVLSDGEGLKMEQGGKHIMLLGLKQPLLTENTLIVNLHYADGTQQAVEVAVTDKAAATDHSHHH